MKSKIKIVVIGLIILCLTGVYAIIDKTVSVYDTKCDTSAFQSVALEPGKEIAQSFVCTEKHLDGVSMKVAADGVTDKKQTIIKYTIVEDNTGETVAEGETNLSKLSSGKFFKIKFTPVQNTQDKRYTLKIAVVECVTGNIRVFYTPGGKQDIPLLYDNQSIDGIGVMRSVTHRFDMETYIVTLCFVIYIILFMKWLYKLFE